MDHHEGKLRKATDMCLICVEYEKERMTIPEARRALGEMRRSGGIDEEHAQEIQDMLDDDEDLQHDSYWFPEWDVMINVPPNGTGESD